MGVAHSYFFTNSCLFPCPPHKYSVYQAAEGWEKLVHASQEVDSVGSVTDLWLLLHGQSWIFTLSSPGWFGCPV